MYKSLQEHHIIWQG